MTLKQIRTIIEQETEIDISIHCRRKEHVLARAIYCLVARELTNRTLKAIGEEINRKHDSVLHLINNAKIFVKHEQDYKKLYLDVLSIIDFGAKEDEIPEENIKVIEKIVYRDFNDNLRQCEKDILKDLKMLNDTDILDLHKTRLRPFISMLKSKRVQQVKEVKGATRRHSIQMY